MKNKFIKLFLATGAMLSVVSCSDFQAINEDPNAVPEDQMQIDYMLAGSIFRAQQDPDIAERMFILNWDRVSRYERPGGLSTFSANDDWLSSYWGTGNMGRWIKDATIAIQIGDKKIKDGLIKDSEKNLYQMSRIWRAYLYGEYCDGYGPVAISQYDGTTPPMSSVNDVYKFILSELKDASEKLNTEYTMATSQVKNDHLYACDIALWKKYANSMILRYALRIGDQAAFEEAAAKGIANLIAVQADIAAVQEKGGWDATTGVMTRGWNAQQLSLTYANLTVGLGGVDLASIAAIPGTAANGMKADIISKYSKDPQKYLGLRMKNYLSDLTNVSNAQYFMDYLPSKIDPRALVNFSIPGYDDKVVQNYVQPAKNFNSNLLYANGKLDAGVPTPKDVPDTIKFRAAYTFHSFVAGDNNVKGSNFAVFTNENFNLPAKSRKWRDNNNKRLFFGPWETYFLLAEAALKGWKTPIGDQAAYESGVKASFDYFNVSPLVGAYLTSNDYNRVGTSVAYNHTSEITEVVLDAVDLDANLEVVATNGSVTTYQVATAPVIEKVTYKYPKGAYATNNDKLTKIITQKYIANSPWLPLEAWSDYRRLNLPFMENPVVEKALTNMPWYSAAQSGSFVFQNVVQRFTYPSGLRVSNPDGYNSGVAALGGADAVGTPLSWAKKN